MAMDAERQAIRSIEILCKLFGLHRERRWVVDAARRHPTFPSLESMAHAFSVRGLEAVALRCGYEDLRDMPLPSLVVVRGRREPLFCVVDSVDSEQVHFALSPDGGAGLAKAEAFQALWEGAVMVFNREGYTLMPHPDGGMHRMVRGVRRGVWGVLSILFVLGLFWVLTDAQSIPDWDWKSMTLTLLPFVGSWLSGLLIVASEGGDQLVRRLCSLGGTHGDCQGFLQLRGAKLWGVVSWSDLGFAYFGVLSSWSLLRLLGGAGHGASLLATALLSILALGYIPYSLVYQRFVAKQWCVLCLAVQVVFALMGIAALGGWSGWLSRFGMERAWIDGLVGIGFLSLFMWLRPMYSAARRAVVVRRRWNALRYTPPVQQVLFSQEDSYDLDSIPTGLMYSSPVPEDRIALIISPFCAICAGYVRSLVPVIRRKHAVRLDVVILVDRERHGVRLYDASLQLVRNVREGMALLDALEAYEKQLTSSRSLGLDRSLYIEEDSVLQNHQDWCNANGISEVPILLLNGKHLPWVYEVGDMDYLVA